MSMTNKNCRLIIIFLLSDQVVDINQDINEIGNFQLLCKINKITVRMQ